MVVEWVALAVAIGAIALTAHLYKKSKTDLSDLKEDIHSDNLSTAELLDRARREGGKFKKRDKKTAGLDLARSVNEKVNISENVVVVKKNVRGIQEHVPVSDTLEVKKGRAKKTEGVLEKKKEFTVDAILVNEEDEENKK